MQPPTIRSTEHTRCVRARRTPLGGWREVATKRPTMPLRAADGQAIATKGFVSLYVRFTHYVVRGEFLVCESLPVTIIMGAKFIDKHVLVNFPKGTTLGHLLPGPVTVIKAESLMMAHFLRIEDMRDIETPFSLSEKEGKESDCDTALTSPLHDTSRNLDVRIEKGILPAPRQIYIPPTASNACWHGHPLRQKARELVRVFKRYHAAQTIQIKRLPTRLRAQHFETININRAVLCPPPEVEQEDQSADAQPRAEKPTSTGGALGPAFAPRLRCCTARSGARTPWSTCTTIGIVRRLNRNYSNRVKNPFLSLAVSNGLQPVQVLDELPLQWRKCFTVLSNTMGSPETSG